MKKKHASVRPAIIRRNAKLMLEGLQKCTADLQGINAFLQRLSKDLATYEAEISHVWKENAFLREKLGIPAKKLVLSKVFVFPAFHDKSASDFLEMKIGDILPLPGTLDPATRRLRSLIITGFARESLDTIGHMVKSFEERGGSIEEFLYRIRPVGKASVSMAVASLKHFGLCNENGLFKRPPAHEHAEEKDRVHM